MSDKKVDNPEEFDQAALDKEKRMEQNSQNIRRRFKVLIQELLIFLKELLALKEETDYEQTRNGIIRDVPFRGPTVYILICSIIIASVGLNLNSPAVIIGAMLIAPLMGPILGIGLAFGTNDSPLLGKALKNFGVMVFISLFTSTLYFLITPLVEHQPEILARTTPTTLDILVAIFGGIAGIIAGSRREKSNVIPGVAIATALMPPLCTSGFGLATGNWSFFFGAFYLFMLNSIFICGATIVGVRYLGFPMKKFINKQRERKVRNWMATVMIVMIFPSLWIFYGVVKESFFKNHSATFVKEVVKMKGARLVDSKFIYTDTVPTIELFMIGVEIPKDTIRKWQNKMPEYGLGNSKLDVYGIGESDNSNFEVLSGKLKESIQADVIKQFYSFSQEEILSHEKEIEDLQKELLKFRPRDIKMVNLAKELKIQFEYLEKISYADALESDFGNKVDTIPTILVKWRNGISRSKLQKDEVKIKQILQLRLELDTVRVIKY